MSKQTALRLPVEGLTQWRKTVDKDQYDRPEDEDSVWGRGLGLLLGALAIVVIFFVIFNTGLMR